LVIYQESLKQCFTFVHYHGQYNLSTPKTNRKPQSDYAKMLRTRGARASTNNGETGNYLM